MEAQDSNRELLHVELLFENESFSVAYIALRGINRAAINHKSTTSYTVVRGSGIMHVDGVGYDLSAGSVIAIPRGVPYYDEGELDMIAVSVPPFDASSIEIMQ